MEKGKGGEEMSRKLMMMLLVVVFTVLIVVMGDPGATQPTFTPGEEGKAEACPKQQATTKAFVEPPLCAFSE